MRWSVCAALALLLLALLAQPSHQIPRPKRKEPGSCPYRTGAMSAADTLVQDSIRAHKVVVFSKTYCPFCKKAKAALAGVLPSDAVTVIELDTRDDGDAIQDALQKVSSRRSVPQVFINGKFFGGGDETAAAAADGSLAKLLKSEGVL